MENLDILRSAKICIQQHGSQAVDYATRRAAQLGAAGDNKGADVWLAICSSILWLQVCAPVHGETEQ